MPSFDRRRNQTPNKPGFRDVRPCPEKMLYSAAMAKRVLRFELYSIHAHLATDIPVDYMKLFETMPSLQGYHLEESKHHIAIGKANFSSGRLFIVAYTGYSEKSMLFFDVTAKEELTESTVPGRFQARKTYAMVDGRKRFLLIEMKKGNLSPADLAFALEAHVQTALPEYKSLELVFNPIADVEFIKRLEALARIQAATVTIGRPNPDWTDRHNQLTEVADESNAKALDVTARAKRGKSLSKDAGLVQFVKHFAGSAMTMFQKIKITGQLGADSGLITLDLSKHIEHVNIPFDVDPKTHLPNDGDVQREMSAYLDSKELESKEA
jgi:hypothetical protein